ncbi:MAG TPA: DMT family transporter [Solirubrobacteraceae bacterium]|nr:DMT family transporter [Solirubrobacteraceae bacterium]
MDRGLAVVLTAVVGGMLALQGPINSQLGKTIGTFQAAFFSFATGTIILAVIAGLARGGFGQIAEARTLAPQYLIGGALGACYVSSVLVTVRTLGAGGIVAATVAGQLTMGALIDHFGLLGLDKDPISAMKAVGIVLLAVGTLLVVRG